MASTPSPCPSCLKGSVARQLRDQGWDVVRSLPRLKIGVLGPKFRCALAALYLAQNERARPRFSYSPLISRLIAPTNNNQGSARRRVCATQRAPYGPSPLITSIFGESKCAKGKFVGAHVEMCSWAKRWLRLSADVSFSTSLPPPLHSSVHMPGGATARSVRRRAICVSRRSPQRYVRSP